MASTNELQEKIPLSAPDIGEAERAAVLRVLSGPQLCMGPEMAAFEREFAARIGVEDAIAVSSGTAGLHLALLALGIGAGGEIIIPSFAFVAVANVLLQIGAQPVFAEIDEHTLNLDPASVEAAITSKTRAIIVVHTFGVPADLLALSAICQRHNLALIEDACEALGATINSRPAGSFGDAAVFGFYPNKQITTGEGGMVIVRGRDRAAHVRRLRNQGRGEAEGWLEQSEPGFNYRLSEIACALGRVQLSRLEEILALRRLAAEHYDVLLNNVAEIERPPLESAKAAISWFVYVIRLRAGVNRDRVQQVLAQQGIATSKYFAPIHQLKFWQNYTAAAGISLPITERISNSVLALPFFTRISATSQGRVVNALLESIK
jgi:perosamine synthetase